MENKNVTPYDALTKMAEQFKRALGIPETKKEDFYDEEYDDETMNEETKDNDLMLTIDPYLFNRIDSIVHDIFREKKELEQIKSRTILFATSIISMAVVSCVALITIIFI